ncbi:MAG: autotransporter-associated beta strand repeat-containing protein [Verrucomicrobia bacterium]|nr:autotransporter-associated beta strand repeat-containing protein [Verrucomicrobiota bacterium]
MKTPNRINPIRNSLKHLALVGSTARIAGSLAALALAPAHAAVISGGDFQLYQPGSTTVTAELTGGYVPWSGVIPPTNLTVGGGSANYSDSTTGATVDLLGWSKIQGSADLLYNGPGGSMALNCFAAWGGDTRVETTGSLHTIAAGETIIISVDVSGGGGPMTGPLAFHLYANGSLLTPSSSVNVSGTANQTISRTYGPADLLAHVGQPTKIVLGVEDANDEGGRVIFDNVTLATSVPDITAPTLISFEDNKGGGPVVTNEPVTYTVTFSEPMSALTVDAADFANTGATAMTVNSVTPTANPAVFSVVVTPTEAGTLQLQVAAGATLKDLEGNALDPGSAIPDDSSLVVTDDPFAPTLTSIGDNVGGGPIVGGQTVIYTVTFNEGMNASTVGIDDFDNAGSPSAIINSVAPTGNPAVFTVSVTSAEGIGTLQLRILADAVLTDIAGNAMVALPALDDNPIITTLPPTYRWQGMDGADWSVAGNWNNTVPGATHTAILSDNASAGATLNLDTDVMIAGLTFNNEVVNQTIASTSGKTLTLASGGKVTVDAGSHSISANVNSPGTVMSSGPGALTLSGTANSVAGSFLVDGGSLTIPGGATLAVSGQQFTVRNGSTMEVSGTVNSTTWSTIGMDALGATESTMILKDSGQFNNINGFLTVGDTNANDGRLIIQDSAQVNSSLMILGQYGGAPKGYVIQNSGAVNLTNANGQLWYACAALQIGSGAALVGWTNGQGEYHLNGGMLTAHSIGGGGVASSGTGKLCFNGGTLKPTVSDDAVAAKLSGIGQTVFMQNLTQVVVEQNGAIIDTADGLSISIDQTLLPGTGTGGLTKQGLGTLKLLQASTYTGPTKVLAGTLACATAASVAPTALEIDAAAKLDLQYAGNQAVPSLKVGADVKDPGVYGSSASPAPLANQDDVHFAGTGTVTVGAGYTAWANANNATGQTPDQDHDNDSVDNGLEYFMGQTGSSFTAMPGLDGTNTITWPMVAGYAGTYEVQTSPDLATWTNVTPRPTPAGGNLSYLLPTGMGKQFVRLLVTPTP